MPYLRSVFSATLCLMPYLVLATVWVALLADKGAIASTTALPSVNAKY